MADAKRFLDDVRNHQMTIELDQGVHRCLFFGRPGSSAYHFRLITWPGHLAISGGCGSYSFARLRDMFEFFRDAGPDYEREDRINTVYWREKLQSVDCHHGESQFDRSRYEKIIRSDMDLWIEQFDKPEQDRILEDAQSCGLFEACDTLDQSLSKACGWKCPVTGDYPNADFWEHSGHLMQPSFHLMWCMRAIQWGIKRYDLHHQRRTQADHDRRVLKGAA